MPLPHNRASDAAAIRRRSDVAHGRYRAARNAAREKAAPPPAPGRLFGEIAGLDYCWCGSKDGHDWPGRDSGAPHPRDR